MLPRFYSSLDSGAALILVNPGLWWCLKFWLILDSWKFSITWRIWFWYSMDFAKILTLVHLLLLYFIGYSLDRVQSVIKKKRSLDKYILYSVTVSFLLQLYLLFSLILRYHLLSMCAGTNVYSGMPYTDIALVISRDFDCVLYACTYTYFILTESGLPGSVKIPSQKWIENFG